LLNHSDPDPFKSFKSPSFAVFTMPGGGGLPDEADYSCACRAYKPFSCNLVVRIVERKNGTRAQGEALKAHCKMQIERKEETVNRAKREWMT
jgi:hypothetical protein